ncbi:MAG: inosine/xanthosine triphosphatase [Patescibacteria group bacterium]|jgi:inosine/xanthosine triphosphatase|nr:inosine/xanthosine triphosphatase [Patescibacteria group bacterium]
MKIAIGTTSELKVRALKSAVVQIDLDAEIIPHKTDSGVSVQPFGYDEIILGATNRAMQCKKDLDCDISLSVESGLVKIGDDYFDIACVCAISKDGNKSFTYSAGYFVPEWMIREIKENKTELGFITQRLSGDTDKDPLKYFSNNVIKREELLSQAIILAIVKLFNVDRYIIK